MILQQPVILVKGKLLDQYLAAKTDTGSLSVMLLQVFNKPTVRSLAFHRRGEGGQLMEFSKDIHDRTSAVLVTDWDSLKNCLVRIDQDMAITDGRITSSTYNIIVVVKIGQVQYEVKTTNEVLLHGQHPYLDGIRRFLTLVNVDLGQFVEEYIDG